MFSVDDGCVIAMIRWFTPHLFVYLELLEICSASYFFPPHKCGVCLTHTVSEFHLFSSACRTGHYIQLSLINVHPTGPWLLYWMPWDCWHRKGGAIICRISGLIAITWSPLDCEGASYFNCGAFRPAKPLRKQLDTSALVEVNQKCWSARTVKS